jgi:hypothetical protein
LFELNSALILKLSPSLFLFFTHMIMRLCSTSVHVRIEQAMGVNKAPSCAGLLRSIFYAVVKHEKKELSSFLHFNKLFSQLFGIFFVVFV